jgi:hypothetical protein
MKIRKKTRVLREEGGRESFLDCASYPTFFNWATMTKISPHWHSIHTPSFIYNYFTFLYEKLKYSIQCFQMTSDVFIIIFKFDFGSPHHHTSLFLYGDPKSNLEFQIKCCLNCLQNSFNIFCPFCGSLSFICCPIN